MNISINYAEKHLYRGLTFGLLILLSSCSLLKFTIESKEEPLPKNLLNTRIAVRAFQREFSSDIIAVSDTIIANTSDIDIKLNAIAFKKGIVAASGKTAFQAVPELALVDTWVLCKQLKDVMESNLGKEFIGSDHILVKEKAVQLENRITEIARTLLKEDRYSELESFVNKYALENPVTSFDFPRANILSPLSKHLGVADTVYVSTIGSGAEALSDIGDRIGITSELLGKQLGWEKERFSLEWDRANPSDDFLARADSISLILDRFANVAENSPELMGNMSANMRSELMPLINELNGGIDASLYKLADERLRMQLYLDAQRKLLVSDVNATGEQMIDTSTKSIATLIKDVAWIVILAAIIIIALLFSIPFLAGFYLAKARFKTKDNLN